LLNATNTGIENVKISPKHLTEMLDLVGKGAINRPTVKVVFEDMLHTGKGASEIITKKKLSQISDADEIREVVKQVMANDSEAMSDYSFSKQQALTFITGQIMGATRGRANPGMARKIVIQELGGK
jgi:aspartyl-tRNA(Asn)/glutamyl-tRNA(Gln) amidotransferase subunit B